MRTTLDLPEDLLGEALEVSGEKTKTAVIKTALEEFVRKKKIAALKDYRGAIDLEIDSDILRNRR